MRKYEMKRFTLLLITLLLAGSMALTACTGEVASPSGDLPSGDTVSTPWAPPAETPATWSEFDLNDTWTEQDTHINLTPENTQKEWQGAKLVSDDLYIRAEGTYVLSGTLNGQLFISTDKTKKVHLVFNGFTVNNDTLTPILCERGDKVVITLAEGTENFINDNKADYVDGGATPDGRNAGAIHAKMGLTINGTGSLTVNTVYRHGIVSNSNLRIVSGNITVNAKEEGLRGKESVSIRGGNVTVKSGDDGVKVNQADEEGQGFFAMEGGTLQITTDTDGIDVIKNVRIVGGTIRISSRDDAIVTEGTVSIAGNPVIRLQAESGSDDSDAKGIKADGDITVESGTLQIIKSFEGLESKNASVRILGGKVNVNATNDGVNAATLLSVEGGALYVTTGGDGLDSGGNIHVKGGTTVICGSPSNAFAPMDVPDGCEILVDGGFLLAYGSLSAVQYPAQKSAQSFLGTSVSLKKDVPYALRDQNGNTLVTFTPGENALTLCFSSEALAAGKYTLFSGVTPEGTPTGGVYTSSTGGEEVATFTVS